MPSPKVPYGLPSGRRTGRPWDDAFDGHIGTRASLVTDAASR